MRIKRTLFKGFNLDQGLLSLIAISVIFFPLVKLNSSFFLGIEEILIALAGIRVVQLRKLKLNYYVWFLIGFTAYISFVVLTNSRSAPELANYFAMYKMGKFIVLFLFAFSVVNFTEEGVHRFVVNTYTILLVFNGLHYFDVLGFNSIIEPLYDLDGRDLLAFGKNSIGEPATKRMFGTMGNPNDNAILLLLYVAYFFSRIRNFSRASIQDKMYFYLGFLSIILCQSRTGFVAYLVLFLLWVVTAKVSTKVVLINILIFGFLVSSLLLNNSQSVEYFTNTKVNISQNMAVRGRFEMWSFLWEMIIQKPVFGWGPNKKFFYKNAIYPENEYIFYLWKFGFIGLVGYLSWVLLPLYRGVQFLKKSPFYLFIVIIILIGGLTNVPLSNPRIMVLFAIIVGYSMKSMEKDKRERVSRPLKSD
jgi:O-antigen ligase